MIIPATANGVPDKLYRRMFRIEMAAMAIDASVNARNGQTTNDAIAPMLITNATTDQIEKGLYTNSFMVTHFHAERLGSAGGEVGEISGKPSVRRSVASHGSGLSIGS